MSNRSPSAKASHWLWPPLLLLGCVTAVIAWMLVALSLGLQSGWMAVLAALEVVWMLRLGNLAGGPLRVAVALAGTTAIIALANWGIAAAQIGAGFGMDPWTSALKLGPGLAWTLLSLANGALDLVCYTAALVLAWVLAR